MYTVLVVDDEPANLQMVEYTLSDEYDVVPVKSGQMALKYLENSIPGSDSAGYSYATDGWL